MSLEDRIQLEERAKKRAYEAERMGQTDVGPLQSAGIGRGYIGEAGNVLSNAEVAEAPDVRWQLENRLSQLLREADGIQALLDTLPAKVPPRAAHALRLLILK
jgi:hypothetical protein